MGKLRAIDEDLIDRIQHKLEWEGLDYYLENYAAEDFAGTILEEPLERYLDALSELKTLMEAEGIDV